VFVQGRITGGDSSDVHFIASGPSAVCVFGGLLRFGAESRIDARSDADLFFQAASDLRLGPDGELDAGGARVVLGGRLRGRGKPDVGTGMQLFIRTLQLVGPGPKVKARGGGADVLFGVTDGKHWDSARFVGTIDVRGVDGGSVEFAGQALDVEGKIDARGGETGGTIAFDSSATPVLPPCASLRVSGGLADGSVTQNGAPICP
jgi:hypothetical protein